jgi:tetratricopeptide (TPR) repeat protein
MKNVTFICLMCILANIPAQAETLPEYLTALRDALYEQNLKADEISDLYEKAKQYAEASPGQAERFIFLSRCEYFMGRAYQFEERKGEAAARYEAGIGWAEKALDVAPSAEAWVILAENISQSCAVRSTAYAMANGLKVEKYAKNALGLDARNAAAQYMVAARWVYAPSPFHNYRKGIDMMTEIISNGDMQRDDQFNVFSAIGYTYIQQKKYADARPWLIKSLEIYPTNKYVRELLGKS